jgi:hypothetical protein
MHNIVCNRFKPQFGFYCRSRLWLEVGCGLTGTYFSPFAEASVFSLRFVNTNFSSLRVVVGFLCAQLLPNLQFKSQIDF